MCIGIPMKVVTLEPGHALCRGRGEERRVRTALVGEVAPGDFLLVFLDSAHERLDEARALEIDATLDLVEAALQGRAHDGETAFVLPSSLSLDQLHALTGQPTESPTP